MPTGLKGKVDQAAANQALARPDSTVLSIFKDAGVKARLAVALNSHPALSPERFLLVAGTECSRNPKLLSCTRGSFLQALEMSAHLGLEVGGPLGHFYLVPFKNNKRGGQLEVVPILGYKGMIVLARRSGEISGIAARPVFSNDVFEWQYGLEDRLVHKPALGDRGTITAFYGVANFTNGGHQMLVMSKADVDKFRQRSRAKDEGPWVTDYEAMGAKTVIRRMSAFLPLTVEAATAIAEDEERELGLSPDVIDLEALAPANGASSQGEPTDEHPAATGGQKQGVASAVPDSATTPAASPAAAAEEGGGVISKEEAPKTPPSSAPADDPGAAFRA